MPKLTSLLGDLLCTVFSLTTSPTVAGGAVGSCRGHLGMAGGAARPNAGGRGHLPVGTGRPTSLGDGGGETWGHADFEDDLLLGSGGCHKRGCECGRCPTGDCLCDLPGVA